MAPYLEQRQRDLPGRDGQAASRGSEGVSGAAAGSERGHHRNGRRRHFGLHPRRISASHALHRRWRAHERSICELRRVPRQLEPGRARSHRGVARSAESDVRQRCDGRRHPPRHFEGHGKAGWRCGGVRGLLQHRLGFGCRHGERRGARLQRGAHPSHHGQRPVLQRVRQLELFGASRLCAVPRMGSRRHIPRRERQLRVDGLAVPLRSGRGRLGQRAGHVAGGVAAIRHRQLPLHRRISPSRVPMDRRLRRQRAAQRAKDLRVADGMDAVPAMVARSGRQLRKLQLRHRLRAQ